MKMDIRLIVLLLVLAVHCQCVNIGQGRTHEQIIAPAVITDQSRELVFHTLKKSYIRFTGWRYIPRVNDIIKDIHESRKTLTLAKCLQECHQHNPGSETKCVAVNLCVGASYASQTEKCQLETDSPEFIASLPKTYSRCILLSTGLVRGENADSIAKQDHKWDHFIGFHP